METLRDMLKANAEKFGDHPCIKFYDQTITYRQLDQRSNQVANFLIQNGVKKGDIVSIMVGNSPEYLYLVFGASKTGAIAGPVNNWWLEKEVDHLVHDSEPVMMAFEDRFMFIAEALKDDMPSVRKIISVGEPRGSDLETMNIEGILDSYPTELTRKPALSGDDPALIAYTSGTTGFPKGALLTHGGLVFASGSKRKLVDLGPDDVVLCVLPLFFTGGFADLALPCLYSGATIVLRRRFSATEFWSLIEEHRVTGFYIVPTMWTILLYLPEASQVDTSSLKVAISGAAPIPEQELKECQERFSIPILEGYGLTENSGGCLANALDLAKAGSVGKPMQGMEVTIFDEDDAELPPGEVGEIVTRSEAVMKGYYKRPEETAETLRGGWLHTGDIGYFEAVISYDIMGLGGGQWTVRIKDKEFKLKEGLAEDPDALVKARAGDYYNITTGKIDGVTAVATGRMRIDGNVMLVAQLREMFKPAE